MPVRGPSWTAPCRLSTGDLVCLVSLIAKDGFRGSKIKVETVLLLSVLNEVDQRLFADASQVLVTELECKEKPKKNMEALTLTCSS